MKPIAPLLIATTMMLMPVGLQQAWAQHHHHYRRHHHHHYRHHHHHQTYDPVLASVQAALARAGFYHTRVDGMYGNESAHAIRGFQRSKGMPETGVIDGNLLIALGLNVPAAQGTSTTSGQQAVPATQGTSTTSGQQAVPATQGTSTYQASPAPTAQGQQNVTTPQQTNVPAGYQLVPVNPPTGATSAPATATASPQSTTTPIPNP